MKKDQSRAVSVLSIASLGYAYFHNAQEILGNNTVLRTFKVTFGVLFAGILLGLHPYMTYSEISKKTFSRRLCCLEEADPAQVMLHQWQPGFF